MIDSSTNFQDKFSELMRCLSLDRIVIPKTDFTLTSGLALPILKYKSQIKRSNTEIKHSTNQLSVSFGFEITGSVEEKIIYVAHVHFLLLYHHDVLDNVSQLLNDEQVRGMFANAQSDKLVWPYMRQKIQEMVADAGLSPLVLPIHSF